MLSSLDWRLNYSCEHKIVKFVLQNLENQVKWINIRSLITRNHFAIKPFYLFEHRVCWSGVTIAAHVNWFLSQCNHDLKILLHVQRQKVPFHLINRIANFLELLRDLAAEMTKQKEWKQRSWHCYTNLQNAQEISSFGQLQRITESFYEYLFHGSIYK